jgi:hypothetical protein
MEKGLETAPNWRISIALRCGHGWTIKRLLKRQCGML